MSASKIPKATIGLNAADKNKTDKAKLANYYLNEMINSQPHDI